jgi:hypothetical protein
MEIIMEALTVLGEVPAALQVKYENESIKRNSPDLLYFFIIFVDSSRQTSNRNPHSF